MMFGSLSKQCGELLDDNAIEAYIKRCIELCWLMVVQDPPMAMITDVGEDCKYDKSKFREYTKTGPFIDYIVWPAVLIQEGGDMMAKGVAQCRDTIIKSNEELESYRTVTEEANCLQDEKEIEQMGKMSDDLQDKIVSIHVNEVEKQMETKERDIQIIEKENELSTTEVDNDNVADKTANQAQDKSVETVEEVDFDTNAKGKEETEFQLTEKENDHLLSKVDSDHAIYESKVQTHDKIYTENENGNSFSEEDSGNADKAHEKINKTNEALEFERVTQKTYTKIADTTIEQLSMKEDSDHESDKRKVQEHNKIVETSDTVERDTDVKEDIQIGNLSTKVASSHVLSESEVGAQAGDVEKDISRDVKMKTAQELVSLSDDSTQPGKISDTMSATDLNNEIRAKEAIQINEEQNENKLDTDTIAGSKGIEDANSATEAKQCNESLSITEGISELNIKERVGYPDDSLDTNMNPNVNEVNTLIAKSFGDSSSTMNEEISIVSSTANNGDAIEEISSRCVKAIGTLTEIDVIKGNNQLGTKCSGTETTKREAETSGDECIVDVVIKGEEKSITIKEEQTEKGDDEEEEEQEFHNNFSEDNQCVTEKAEGNNIEMDSRVPTALEAGNHSKESGDGEDFQKEANCLQDEKEIEQMGKMSDDLQDKIVSIHVNEVEKQMETKERDIQIIEKENELSTTDNDNVADKTANQAQEKSVETVEEVDFDTNANGKEETEFQLTERENDHLLSKVDSDHAIYESTVQTHDKIYTENENGNSFSEEDSGNADKAHGKINKTNEALEFERVTQKTYTKIADTTIEQLSMKEDSDHESDKRKVQEHNKIVETSDTVERDTDVKEDIKIGNLSTKVASSHVLSESEVGAQAGDVEKDISRDVKMKTSQELVSLSDDSTQPGKISDTMSAMDLNNDIRAKKAIQINEEKNENKLDTDTIAGSKGIEDANSATETKQCNESLSIKEGISELNIKERVGYPDDSLDTNMNPNVNEVNTLIAKSFGDSSSTMNEEISIVSSTANNGDAIEEISSRCVKAIGTLTEIDVIKGNNQLGTKCSGTETTKREAETSGDECIVDVVIKGEEKSITIKEEQTEKGDDEEEEEQEFHNNFSEDNQCVTEKAEGNNIEMDSRVPTALESGNHSKESGDGEDFQNDISSNGNDGSIKEQANIQ